MTDMNKDLIKTKLDLQDAMNDFTVQTMTKQLHSPNGKKHKNKLSSTENTSKSHDSNPTLTTTTSTTSNAAAVTEEQQEQEENEEDEEEEDVESLTIENARLKTDMEKSQEEIVSLIEKNENLEDQCKLLEQMGSAYEQVCIHRHYYCCHCYIINCCTIMFYYESIGNS